MALQAGSAYSEYRLKLDGFASDIKAAEGMLRALQQQMQAIKPPELGTSGAGAASAKAAAELAKANAEIAQAQQRATAATQQAEQAALRTAIAQQRLAQAEQQATVAAQRAAQAQARTAQAQNQAEQSALRLAAAQQRAAQAVGSTGAAVSKGGGLASAFKGSLLELAGSFGIVTTGAAAATLAVTTLIGAFNTRASLVATQQQFTTLVGSVELANAKIEEATAFAERYKIRQSEVNAALAAAAPILKDSTSATEQQLSALTRLAGLNPAAGIEGAVFALRELTSASTAGEGILSLVERFNLSKSTATELFNEIKGGTDVFVALDAMLNQVGATQDLLTNRTQGVVGAQNAAAKAAEDFQLALGQLVQGPGTAALNFFADLTNSVTEFINLASGQAGARGGAGIIEATQSYAAYSEAVLAANAAQQQLVAQKDPLGALFGLYTQAQLLTQTQYEFALSLQQSGLSAQQAQAAVQGLSDTQVLYTQNLVNQGVALDQAVVRAQAQGAEFERLQQLVANAGEGLVTYEGQILAAAAAGDAQVTAVQNLVMAYNIGSISGDQLVATLAAIEATSYANEQAALAAAAAADEQAAANAAMAEQTQVAAASMDIASLAAADEQAALQAATQAAYETALAKGDLEAQAMAAARALLQSGDAGASAAARLAASSSQVDVLTAAYYRLIAAQNQAGATGAAGSLLQIGKDIKSAAEATRTLRNTIRATNLSARGTIGPVGGGGGGGGGRARRGGRGGGGGAKPKKSEAEKAAEKAAKEQERIEQRRAEIIEDAQEKLEEQRLRHEERMLEIQQTFAEKQLAAEKQLRLDSLTSRADFYDALTQATPEIGQEQAQALSAAYEQAFAEAQKFAQEGKAELAARYLELKQQQIQAELQFQQKVAAARKEGDDAEVQRLQAIEQLRRQAREEELKQLLEGGDQNVAARDKALSDEAQANADAQRKIVEAAGEKVADLVKGEQAVTLAVRETNSALAEQLRLQAAISGRPPPPAQAQQAAGAPELPTLPEAQRQARQAATPLPVAADGAPILVTDASVLAAIQQLSALLGSIQGTSERTATATEGTQQGIGETRQLTRDLIRATKFAGRNPGIAQ